MAIQLDHHADMLADRVRLDAYRRAIAGIVRPEENVVDIGSGLGVLAGYAAEASSRQVVAVEYLPELAEMSRRMLASDRVRVVTGRSYDLTLDPAPDVVVTETIGPVGPEENIVEITADLKRRHPSIRQFIPSRLSLKAQAIFSPKAQAAQAKVMDSLMAAASAHFDARPAGTDLIDAYCKQVFQDDLSDGVPCSEDYMLAEYHLGVTSGSGFRTVLTLPRDQSWNAVSIFFVASLSEDVELTNHYAAPLTHWLHSYIYRRDDLSRVTIAYDDSAMKFAVQWMAREEED